MVTPDSNYRADPKRSVFIQGSIDQSLVDRLTPQIIHLQSQSREPITVYIDSRGGNTLHAESIRRLLNASDQDGNRPCRIITVATTRAASAAADLLTFGDYAMAYPDATVFYHGVRFTLDDPLTLETASAYTESLRWNNDLYAMSIAKRSVKRFVFRYATIGAKAFPDYRMRSGQPGLTDLEAFIGIVAENISDAARKALNRAQKRYTRYQDLVTRVLTRSAKIKKFTTPKRSADVESVILKQVIDAVASRNKADDWTFRTGAGLTQLSDDFLLLLEYTTSYDSEDLKELCGRFGMFFLTADQQQELKDTPDEDERSFRKLEMLKPVLRPVWLLFVALCHSLQEGEEHELTATDACWLGLIDEVVGQPAPGSLRAFMEWEPDPNPQPGDVAASAGA